MTRPIPRDDVLSLISAAITETGGRAAFSAKYDLAEGYICNVLRGKTPPAKRICAVVGVVPAGVNEWRVR